ncbi:hypothetical protein VII00023_20502 [Vibrio ichthyoenteri ATCC 700023]|uniref:Uncharacterized protein n=1 Tax=Vibrio ichthyoenteri ATCC 700023 TaxID=870968 RepID=F9S7R3_9VIBR|nr:hypothetical protein [Vibrio ichthyoenteri]EGU30963.1 hypothetical protein VII00023_20502 [Vibrio ichthyoenteri ATCC 700023]
MKLEYYSIEKLDDPVFSDLFEKRKKDLEESALRHVRHILICNHKGIDLSLPCFLQPDDPAFVMPDKIIVAKTIELLLELNPDWTKDNISKMLGISTTGSNRLINYWIKSDNGRDINKSNWVVLATKAGLMQLVVAK